MSITRRVVIAGTVIFGCLSPGFAQIPSPNSAYERYEELTRVEPRCAKAAEANIIVVCANRHADRYRLPLVVATAGDPKAEGVAAERERLQYKRSPCQDYSIFLVGCGGVGVTAHTGIGPGGSKPSFRPLAK